MADPANASKYIQKDFEELIKALGVFVRDVAKIIFVMLRQFPGFYEFIKFVCDVVKVFVDGSKAIICDEWIPVGLEVSCMLEDKSKCVTKFDINLLKIPRLTNGGNLQEVMTELGSSSSNAQTNYVAGKSRRYVTQKI
jgi:hypothetical protein